MVRHSVLFIAIRDTEYQMCENLKHFISHSNSSAWQSEACRLPYRRWRGGGGVRSGLQRPFFLLTFSRKLVSLLQTSLPR